MQVKKSVKKKTNGDKTTATDKDLKYYDETPEGFGEAHNYQEFTGYKAFARKFIEENESLLSNNPEFQCAYRSFKAEILKKRDKESAQKIYGAIFEHMVCCLADKGESAWHTKVHELKKRRQEKEEELESIRKGLLEITRKERVKHAAKNLEKIFVVGNQLIYAAGYEGDKDEYYGVVITLTDGKITDVNYGMQVDKLIKDNKELKIYEGKLETIYQIVSKICDVDYWIRQFNGNPS